MSFDKNTSLDFRFNMYESVNREGSQLENGQMGNGSVANLPNTEREEGGKRQSYQEVEITPNTPTMSDEDVKVTVLRQ